MTIKEALAFGAKQLKKNSAKAARPPRRIEASPLLDASVLLCEALKKSKEFIYTYPEKKLTAEQIKKYKSMIGRRAKHEPLAYIIGKKEFYGLDFSVAPAVLIPRPDTEILINAVLSTVGHSATYSYPQVIDVGTGSGAIAITLKKLFPKAQVFATDISQKSLNLAKKNARRLNAKITFKKGNLLNPFKSLLLDTRYPIVITANLPYLSRVEWQKTQPEIKNYEPKGALVGGKNGTEIYEKLFTEISALLRHSAPSLNGINSGGNPMYLFIEIGYNQKAPITKLLNKILRPKKIKTFKDLNNKWRTVKIILS